jgi:hypothetical protein
VNTTKKLTLHPLDQRAMCGKYHPEARLANSDLARPSESQGEIPYDMLAMG